MFEEWATRSKLRFKSLTRWPIFLGGVLPKTKALFCHSIFLGNIGRQSKMRAWLSFVDEASDQKHESRASTGLRVFTLTSSNMNVKAWGGGGREGNMDTFSPTRIICR